MAPCCQHSELRIASRDHHSPQSQYFQIVLKRLPASSLSWAQPQPWPAPPGLLYSYYVTRARLCTRSDWSVGPGTASDWLSLLTVTLSPRQLSHHSPGPAVWPGYNWNIPTKKTFVLSLRLNDLSWWICDPSLGPVSHFNVAHDPGK